MRVRHLCGHVETEIFFIVVINLVTNADLPDTTLRFVCLLLENRIKARVKEFLNIFNQNRFALRASLSKCSL